MYETPSCINCKVKAPETQSDFTLINTQKWRLAQRSLADGSVSLEWRCPPCWRRYRDATNHATASENARPEARRQPSATPRPPPDPKKPRR